ncbi:hypothetical protein ACHAWO_011526 [Cyclotella atomus]|uniref:Uncharacterized protein n=1 Tax=Cyclotella atomus TaxID=382360 RepID=A0ABD3MNG5_9STRA
MLAYLLAIHRRILKTQANSQRSKRHVTSSSGLRLTRSGTSSLVKLNLLSAECQYARGQIDNAAESYDSAIRSAREHKFDNKLALACELAGYFYKEQGNENKAIEMFKQSRDAYIKWGAIGKAQTLPYQQVAKN